MNFTKFFLVVALILAVVGSSVAAPVLGVGVKAAASKYSEKLLTKIVGEKAVNQMATKASLSAFNSHIAKTLGKEAVKETGKKVSKKKVAAAVIGTGAVVGTGAWAVNQFNKAGAQPVEEQPKTE